MSVKTPTRSLRHRQARTAPAPITTRHECPRCGQNHSLDEHGLVQIEQYRALDAAGLRHIRQMALEELAAAVLGGADSQHLERVARLAARVDKRLEQLAD